MAEELKVNFVNMAHMGKRAANLRKDSMYLCALAVLGLLLIIAISVSGLIMNYLTAVASLERSSQGFMTNVPEYMKWSLMPLLDPIRLHLESGLSFVHSKGTALGLSVVWLCVLDCLTTLFFCLEAFQCVLVLNWCRCRCRCRCVCFLIAELFSATMKTVLQVEGAWPNFRMAGR